MAHRQWIASAILGPLLSVLFLTSSCGGSSAQAVVATGSVHCSGIVGTVSFSPPLTASATSSNEKIAVTAHLSHCSDSASDVSDVSGGVASLTIAVPTNACSGLLQFPSSVGGVSTPSSSQKVTVIATWIGTKARPSLASFSGFTLSTDDDGDPGFAFPGVGHKAEVSGSFTGKDDGALSTASVFTDESAGQLLKRCSQLSGLGSLTISSGELTLE